MKLKYYLRGLGIGIVFTTLILMISFSNYEKPISDAEIIKRAEALGMVMKEDVGTIFDKNKNTESIESEETETMIDTEEAADTEVVETQMQTTEETESETEIQTETEQPHETEKTSEDVGVTGETYRLVIKSGDVPRLICKELEENGVITSASALRQYLSDVGYARSIVIGEYEIPYGATKEEVYRILKNGPKE